MTLSQTVGTNVSQVKAYNNYSILCKGRHLDTECVYNIHTCTLIDADKDASALKNLQKYM